MDEEPAPEAEVKPEPAPAPKPEIRLRDVSAETACSQCHRPRPPHVRFEVRGLPGYLCEECATGRAGRACPACGSALDPGDAFCGRCGSAAERACRDCGTRCEAGDRFCGKCGRGL